MRFSLAWLREHLDGGAEAGEMARRLTAAGLNVELREPRGEDEVWDVDITTNRPDAMNHRGLAREAAAAGLGRLRPCAPALRESGEVAAALARVTVEDGAGCPRYCARVVRGVRVGPSPAWMAERLEACGIRPINAVVDVTNYVLLELGQPLHAFDLDRLTGREIWVRRARAGEALTTLDGVRRELTAEDLVIADAEIPVALAGVMGGLDSEITAATTDVLLESATFEPATVRRTARRVGLTTEASYRFERGADRAMAALAVDRAAALLAEVCGGTVALGRLDSAPGPTAPKHVALSLARLDAFAGCEIPGELVLGVLADLEFAPRREGDRVTCTVPSHRVDVELAEDVYEEVLRHYGYDRIPAQPLAMAAAPGARLGTLPVAEQARSALAAAGLAEAITFTFVSAELEAAAAASPLAARGEAIPVTNPLSARLAVLRRSPLAGLLEAAAGNLRRGADRVALGEVGRAFFHRDGAVVEEERLSVVLAGAAGPWDGVRALDFWDLKGVVEVLQERLGIAAAWRPAAAGMLADGAAAELVEGDRVVGVAGRLADRAAGVFEADVPLWVAELDLAAVTSRGDVTFRPLPRFPAVVADMTARHALTLPYERIEAAVRAAAPSWLETVAPTVRYQGKGVAAGEVKTTLRLTYRHPERSLTQEEVNQAHFAVMESLTRELGVSF